MNTSSVQETSLWKRCLIALFSAFLIAPPSSLLALPSNLQVAAGQLEISVDGNVLNIDQLTPQAIANWESFSIGANQIVNVDQLGVDSVLLNRVLGANPSELLGQLNANGRVYLINPNGVVVGKEARISVAEFMASALDVSDQDFLNGGDLLLEGESTADIINLGKITASNGDVFLIAHKVVNAGDISAKEGIAALAAGNSVLLMPEGDQRLYVKTDLEFETAGTGLENSGVIDAAQAELKAAGGNVYELAINQSGMVRASGLVNKAGRVFITADEGVVAHAGEIVARDQDGSGGEVLLGGDFQGASEAVANASRVVVTEGAVIDVSASSDTADGGRAIVWADEATRFLGTINGQGGAVSGNGGFAEVSGKSFLDYQGFADLSSANGENGTLLLDPASLTIQASGVSNANPAGGDPYVFEDLETAGSVLLVSTLESQLAASDVTLLATLSDPYSQTTDSSIVVNDAVSWSSGNSLALESANNIEINADLNAGGGDIVFGLGFVADAVAFEGQALTGDLLVDSAASVTANTVTIRNSVVDDFFGNSNFGPMGAIDIDGILNVNTLDIRYPQEVDGRNGDFGGISGGIAIDNVANKIGAVTTSATGGSISGDVTIIDSAGGLTLDGMFNTRGGDVTIATVGDLTLSAGTQIVAREGYASDDALEPTGGDIYLAAQGGDFINQSNASALVANDGRFLVYSSNPTDTVKGGLTGDPVYNKTFAANAPNSISQLGNRFLYSLAPVLTLTANTLAKTVGEANPTLSYTISGLVGGDAATDVFSGTPVLSTTADASSPIGDYLIDVSQGSVTLSDYGYGLSLVDGLLSIQAAALIELLITADDMFRSYGDENPQFTATFDGLKVEDDESVVTGLQFSTTANLQSPVGNYTITPYGASADDYNISYATGTLTVNPRLLTIRALDLEKVYGDSLPSYESQITGLASFDEISDLGTINFSTLASLTRTDVGQYTITPTGGNNSNYSINYQTGTATITPRSATITAPSLSREYGLSNPTYNTTGEGFLSGEFNRDLVDYNEVDVAANVGSYVLTPSGYTDSNYDVSYVNGSLDITKAPLVLTADSLSREYGLGNPTFTYASSGFRLGHALEDVLEGISLDTNATAGTSVGNYTIDISANLLNSNYDLDLRSGTLSVTRAPLVVAPALASRTYGDENPDFEVVAYGLRNGDTADVVTSEQFQVLANKFSNVGSYVLSLLHATTQNYSLSFNTSLLNILPRDLTISADNATREYGDANPAFSASFEGLASFDDESVISNLNLNTTATQGSIAQAYGINATYDLNSNYNITFNPGTLNVTKAPLMITLSNASRLYGDGNSAALSGVNIVEAFGFKLSDDLSEIVLSDVTTSATQASDVGTYLIEGSILSDKYEVSTLNPGALSVVPRPFTVLIDMDASELVREYGDEGIDVTDRLIAGNLANGDTLDSVFEVIDPTQVFTSVGEYDFSGNVVNSNYTLSSFGNTGFVIQQRGLDLVFAGASRLYGDAALNLWNYLDLSDLFVAGDTPETVLSTPKADVVANSDVGNYPISVSSINSNYKVDSVTGDLSITPRPLFVNLNDIQRVFGSDNPSGYASYRVTGGPNDVLEFDSLDNVLQVNAPDVTADVGDYDLTATMLTDNYELRSFEGNMAVTPRQVTVKLPESVRRVYGDENPELDPFTVLTPEEQPDAGLASFHGISDVLSWSLPSADAIPQVLYLSDVLNRNSNYRFDFVGDFSFRIDQRPIYLRLPSFSRLYGDANQSLEIFDATPAGESQGLAWFDSLDTAFPLLNLPDERANVGEYELSTANSNYDIRLLGDRTVVVNPRTLSVGALNETWVYGDFDQGLSVFSLDGSDGFAPFDDNLERRQEILLRSDLDGTTEVGTYNFVNDSFPNYTINLEHGGQLTVRPREVKIHLPGFERIYGEENPDADPLSLVGGSLASFHELSDVITLENEAPGKQANVGVYELGIQENPNYAFTYEGLREYTIEKRSLFYRIYNSVRNYGDEEGLRIETIFKTDTNGLADFDTFGEVVQLNVPDAQADVGRYKITAEESENYDISLYSNVDGEAPYVQILVRPLAVNLPGFDRLYGDANVLDTVTLVSGTLPSFASISDVFDINMPDEYAVAGTYDVIDYLDTKNYSVSVKSGSDSMTISPRVLNVVVNNAFGTYGEDSFDLDLDITGDGLASFDSLGDGFKIDLLDELDRDSASGYYLANSYTADTKKYTVNFTPGVVTILPRQVSLDIDDVSLKFDTLEELSDYLATENLVLNAEVSGQRTGDDMDDVFPIIRYQIVGADEVPALPVAPTKENVYQPTVDELANDADLIGSGVELQNPESFTEGSGVSPVGYVADETGGITLDQYVTVLDGYSTEENYVLTGVQNGSIRLTVPNRGPDPGVVLNSEYEIAVGEVDIDYSEYRDLVDAAEDYEKNSIEVHGQHATLDSLFAGGNFDLGIDMVMGLFQSLLGDGQTMDAEVGSLFYEITRSTSGTLEDVTPFRIQRWFERNADNPNLLAMLAEPLSHYSSEFLKKDPDAYTESEQKFADLLSNHLEASRDKVAAEMDAKYQEWVELQEQIRGATLSDLAGVDVPWSDFMEAAAGEFVAENVEAKIAGSALGAAAGGGAVAGVMLGLTSAVLPFAVHGGATSIIAGGSMTGVGAMYVSGSGIVGSSAVAAGAAVTFPAAIVTGAIVGSVARGIQVFENEEQHDKFDSIQNSVGQNITVSDFSLQSDGEDDTLNQTIMLGALTSLLFP